MHHEQIHENVEVENVEKVGQEEDVQANITCIPLIDLVLAYKIISFLKGQVCLGMLPSVHATKSLANPPISIKGMQIMIPSFDGFCQDQ